MKKEVKRIDTKVQEQLKMLDSHEKMRDEHFTKLIAEEEAKEKPRVTYIQAYNKAYEDSKRITQASREMMEFTTKWNLVKEKLDVSSGLDGAKEDPEAFSKAFNELCDIKPYDLLDKVKRVKQIRRWRKFDTPLRKDLISQAEFMRRVYNNAPKHLKRMGMSDKQKTAADNSSIRMRARWGSY